MLIPSCQFHEAYIQLRNQARCERSAVMIFVAGECDAIAASHIFTSFLRSDDIAFSLKPVSCYEDIAENLRPLDQESYKSIVCINCCATINLEEFLDFSDGQWERTKLYILDSHRPIHFNNVHFDRRISHDSEGQPIFDDDISSAKVIIVDGCDELSEPIPSFEDVVLYEEDFDDFEDDDEYSRPAQRRRLEEGEEENDDEAQRLSEREERRRKRLANLRIEQYLSKGSRSHASAFVMYELATKLRKDTNELLWWAIVGVSDQYLNGWIGEQQYQFGVRVLAEEVVRLNPEDARPAGNISCIALVRDFRFMLLKYWTLYDSMYHSEYIAGKLELWKDRKLDSNQLRTLLAKMGIPRTEAEQKFLSMKASIQEDLRDSLEEWAPRFRIEDFQFDTFHKVRHIAHDISAADCVHITSAMLNCSPADKDKWAVQFYKAYDALQWCASREDLWDNVTCGNSPVIQNAIDIQKGIMQRAFEVLFQQGSKIYKMSNEMGGLRHLCIQINDSNALIAQPMALKKVAQFITKNQARSSKNPVFGLVIAAEDSSSGLCTVVGVESQPATTALQTFNQFGTIFQMAAKEAKDIVIHQCSFDTEVLQFSRCTFQDFIGYVNSAIDRFHDHKLSLGAIKPDEGSVNERNQG